MSASFPSFSLHQMEVGCRLCICVRVYLCMGWRGVGGVKVCVIDQLLIDDRLYSAILRSLEQTHCACM